MKRSTKLMTAVLLLLVQSVTLAGPREDAAATADKARTDALNAAANCLTEHTLCIVRFGITQPDPVEYPSWQDAEDKRGSADDWMAQGLIFLHLAAGTQDDNLAVQLYDQASVCLSFAYDDYDEAACIYAGIVP